MKTNGSNAAWEERIRGKLWEGSDSIYSGLSFLTDTLKNSEHIPEPSQAFKPYGLEFES